MLRIVRHFLGQTSTQLLHWMQRIRSIPQDVSSFFTVAVLSLRTNGLPAGGTAEMTQSFGESSSPNGASVNVYLPWLSVVVVEPQPEPTNAPTTGWQSALLVTVPVTVVELVGVVPKSTLMIPLDTHIARISRHLGLTRRTDLSWRTAEEITESLRRLDPEDPVRYDFTLCHYGMSGICPSQTVAENCEKCPLLGACGTGPRLVKKR